MDTDEHGFVQNDATYAIIGCAMGVINSIGHGFHEKIYENALVAEFEQKKISFKQQPRYEIQHLGIKVGEFIPDLIAFNSIIIDTKTIDQITRHEKGQMMNYLKVTKLKIGLIINFKNPTLEWHRIIL